MKFGKFSIETNLILGLTFLILSYVLINNFIHMLGKVLS